MLLEHIINRLKNVGLGKLEKLKTYVKFSEDENSNLRYIKKYIKKYEIDISEYLIHCMGLLKKYKKQKIDPLEKRERLKEKAGVSLAKKAKASGIPAGILRQVYNRGVAAWRTGHRPGTNPQQWGNARVHSFISKSKRTSPFMWIN